jgi:hypothetical protein
LSFSGLFAYKLAYEKIRWTNYPVSGLFFLSALFPFVSLSVYTYLEQMVGFSPDWSIAKATKWCEVRSSFYSGVQLMIIFITWNGI